MNFFLSTLLIFIITNLANSHEVTHKNTTTLESESNYDQFSLEQKFSINSYSNDTEDAFITTWQVTNSDAQVELYTNPDYNYNYNVDWGDGSVDTNLTANASHTYSQAGTYTVSLTGTFPHIATCQINNFDWIYECSNASKLLSVVQWGSQQWTSMSRTLAYTKEYFTLPLNEAPDLSQTHDMSKMLWGSLANPNINHWNVANVSNMQGLFKYASNFNQPLMNWNVGNVTNMDNLFNFATSFNQPIDKWDMRNVTSTRWMFDAATSFNQPLNTWDMSNVEDVNAMFIAASSFNQPLDNWDVSNVTNFYGMFRAADVFNQNIENWDVSNSESFGYMFSMAFQFNQPLNDWDVSNATNFRHMFALAHEFNQPLNNWDVSNANEMRFMFTATQSFNQDISNWCVVQFSSEPMGFSNASLIQHSFKPQWGEECTSLSLNEVTNNSIDVVLYPLPAKDIINIDYKYSESVNNVYLSNYLGKSIQKIKVDNSKFPLSIDVSNLPKGVYFLKIETNNNLLITKKFLK